MSAERINSPREVRRSAIWSGALGAVLGAVSIIEGFLKDNVGFGVLGGLIAIGFLGGAAMVFKDSRNINISNLPRQQNLS